MQWVPVIVSDAPENAESIQKSSGGECKNVVLSLHWEVVYANVGSVVNPQPKVIGVKCRFGTPKDLVGLIVFIL